ncbi:MAG: DUF448 domain-containing protein [Thermodesulfobacteriota bacterium]
MTTLIRQRTCRACRKKKDKTALLRLTIQRNNVLEADPDQFEPGRGWYLCREGTCLRCLETTKGRQKCFGREVEIGPVLHQLLTNAPAGGDHGH